VLLARYPIVMHKLLRPYNVLSASPALTGNTVIHAVRANPPAQLESILAQQALEEENLGESARRLWRLAIRYDVFCSFSQPLLLRQ
jgi:hypothetical protein